MEPSKSARSEPYTARGQRTRQALVASARTVFERDGFLEARVTDISAGARVAHGTFYTYFDSKESIFMELAVQLLEEMLGPPRAARSSNSESNDGPTTTTRVESSSAGTHMPLRSRDPLAAIERANAHYLEAYRRNAKLMGIIEHVAMFNPRLGVVREARSRSFSERAARSITDLQAQGLADPNLDARLTAMALTGMVSRFAYAWFVAGEADPDRISFDDGLNTVTRLWANAIGLTERVTHNTAN